MNNSVYIIFSFYFLSHKASGCCIPFSPLTNTVFSRAFSWISEHSSLIDHDLRLVSCRWSCSHSFLQPLAGSWVIGPDSVCERVRWTVTSAELCICWPNTGSIFFLGHRDHFNAWFLFIAFFFDAHIMRSVRCSGMTIWIFLKLEDKILDKKIYGLMNPSFDSFNIVRMDIWLVARKYFATRKYFTTRKISARIRC